MGEVGRAARVVWRIFCTFWRVLARFGAGSLFGVMPSCCWFVSLVWMDFWPCPGVLLLRGGVGPLPS